MRIIKLAILFLLLAAQTQAQTGSDEEYDSLKTVFYSLDNGDTSKLRICKQIASGLNNLDSTVAWAERLVDVAQYQSEPLMMAYGYFYKSWAYYYGHDYSHSIQEGLKSLLIADSLKNNDLKFKVTLMIGHNYFSMKDYEGSDDFYLNALEMARLEGDTAKICQCMRHIADTYTNKSMYANASDMYEQVYAIDSVRGNLDDMRRDYHGIVYILICQYLDKFTDQDISLILKAKEYLKKIEMIDTKSVYSKYNVLKAYFFIMLSEFQYYDYQGARRAEVLDTMRNFVYTAREYSSYINLGASAAFDDVQLANYLIASREYKEAKRVIDSLRVLVDSDSATYYTLSPDVNLALDYYYKSLGDMDSAYYFKTKYFEYQLLELSPDYAVQATQNWERAQFQDKIRQREQRIEERQRVINRVLFVAGVVVVFLVVDYLRKRRHNNVLNGKNRELIQQKEEIRAQNEEISKINMQITSSINYASLIQRAVMPKDEYLKSMFTDYFLIYKPLQIVAGDFYWANMIGRYNILVCADSTGHGVPGAFVSMLGISLLNDIVPTMIFQECRAADILNELRDRLMYCLGQSRQLYDEDKLENKDGIDLSIIMMDTELGRVQYAGANRPLWIFRKNGKLDTFKPDRMPIGLYLGEERSFMNHLVDVERGDVLYMFSDGIIDQFGFLDDSHQTYKRFSTKQFISLISRIGHLPLAEQKLSIENALLQWQNGHPQSDDIIVIGVEV